MRKLIFPPNFFNNSALSAWQAYILSRFLMMLSVGVCLVKLGLSKEFIGLYESIILIMSAGSAFWVNGNFQTLAGQYRGQRHEIQTAFKSLFSFSLITGLLLLLFFQIPAKLLHLPSIPVLRGSLFFWMISYPVSMLLEYAWMLEKNHKKLWFSALILQPVIPILLVLSAKFSGPDFMVLAYAAWGIFRLCWLIIWLKPWQNKEKWSLKPAIPLVLANAATTCAPHIDATIIRYFSPEDFPVFQYGARELPIAVMLMASLGEALAPFIKQPGDLSQLKQNVHRYFWPLFLISALLMISSPLIFKIVFSPEYIQSAYIFNIYLLLFIPRMLMPQTWFIGTGQRKTVFIISVADTILNIILSFFLFFAIGMEGLAWGTFIAFSVEKVILIYLLHRQGISIHAIISLKNWIAASSVLSLLYICSRLFWG